MHAPRCSLSHPHMHMPPPSLVCQCACSVHVHVHVSLTHTHNHTPDSEEGDEIKKSQLRQLAMLNGTFNDKHNGGKPTNRQRPQVKWRERGRGCARGRGREGGREGGRERKRERASRTTVSGPW